MSCQWLRNGQRDQIRKLFFGFRPNNRNTEAKPSFTGGTKSGVYLKLKQTFFRTERLKVLQQFFRKKGRIENKCKQTFFWLLHQVTRFSVQVQKCLFRDNSNPYRVIYFFFHLFCFVTTKNCMLTHGPNYAWNPEKEIVKR